ncbi:4-hydroxy-tetrahydrodipicolinate synthase [bacterium]|nr:4-hydroxy-tetrahydrodipicolinate synthase [bacterium]
MTFPLRGVFTAMITPFDANGAFDAITYASLVDNQLKNGVAGIVPCGTTGESPTLSHAEHDYVIELTIDLVKGQIPVIAGTGSNSTAEAIRLSQHAEKVGADAVMVVNPYYNKPTQEGLYLHFKAIANSVKIPCIIYNIKSRTGVNLETETLIRLCQTCPNISGVKEASGDLRQMKDVIANTSDDFNVLSGDDNMAIDLIQAGGDGVISVASNLVPDKMVMMVEAALKSDFDYARKLEYELSILFKALFLETNPIPIKAAMAMAGLCLEQYRLPMCPLSSETHRNRLKETLEELNIIEKTAIESVIV